MSAVNRYFVWPVWVALDPDWDLDLEDLGMEDLDLGLGDSEDMADLGL
jgi:hypothetical protein